MDVIFYADIYILVNAICDWLAFLACGAILSLKVNHLRLLGAVFFLTGYAFISVYSYGGIIPRIFLHAASLCVGCMIAYEIVSFAQFLKILSLFFMGCLVLGGIFSWLYGVTYNRFIMIICLTPIIYFIWLYLSRHNLKNLYKKTVKLSIESTVLTGFVDSGNLLIEPLSGLNVIIVNKNAIKEIIPELTIVIPLKTASGKGYLLGFEPHNLTIEKSKIRAVVAVDFDNSLAYDCLIPISLL